MARGYAVDIGSSSRTDREVVPDAGEYRVDPRWTILGLLLTLVGLVGLAGLLYGIKFHGLHSVWAGIPTRDLFVGSLGLIAAPLFLTLYRRVPTVLLLLPIVTIVLLYPLFTPFGIPYSRDEVYNFQFARALIETGQWVPGAFVSQQAVAYSYFPGGAVLDAEFAVLSGIPLSTSFLLASPLFHLLVLPAAVYAIGTTMFGARVAWGGVLFFLGTPSILINTPVGQEGALPFFALTLLTLCLLLADPSRGEAVGLRVATVVFSSYVIVSHHLTSYVLIAWLALLFLVPYLLGGGADRGTSSSAERRGWELVLGTPHPASEGEVVRVGLVVVRYFLVFTLFVLYVSAPVVVHHLALFSQAIGSLLQGVAPTARVSAVGQSFPLYQQAWVYFALAVLILACFYSARRFLLDPRKRFLVTNVLVAGTATLATIPFLPTSLGFVSLRAMEFSIPFAGPALSYGLVYGLRPWLRTRLARVRLPGPAIVRRYAAPAGVFALAALVFTGGVLVPIEVRDQFAPTSAVTVDSPLHINGTTYALALWARAHFNGSVHVWGDYLTYVVFGGFGGFHMRYSEYQLFNGSTISNTSWHALGPGDYVVVDRFMTAMTPVFPGSPTDQPTTPLNLSQLQKFDDPRYFDRVYSDSMFTIYELLHKPKGL